MCQDIACRSFYHQIFHIGFQRELYFIIHDDVMTWKSFPRHWLLGRGIHSSLVNSLHKRLVMCSFGAFVVISLIKPLNKQSRCGWFQAPWRSFDVTVILWSWTASSLWLVCLHLKRKSQKSNVPVNGLCYHSIKPDVKHNLLTGVSMQYEYNCLHAWHRGTG